MFFKSESIFNKKKFSPALSREGVRGWVIVLFLISFFYFSPAPVHAFDLLEFLFPATKMQKSTRSAPKNAIAPEVVSNDTHSNTLVGDTITTVSTSEISKSWTPPQRDTGKVDSEGNHIYEYYDYTASGTITGEMDTKNLSNNYYRDFQSFISKGSLKCSTKEAKKIQTSFDMDGSNFSTRAVPYKEIAYYRSQFLVEDIKSLDQKNPIDTVVQDYQIAWSCGGTCQELTDKSKTSSCRPIYLSELLFGLQDKTLYYSSKTSSPTTFPSDIISAVNSYYSSSCSSSTSCYSSRSNGKSFSPLSKTTYEMMYKQINFIPKGNVNSTVTAYNYSDYTNNQTTKTTVNRTLPNAASASHVFSEEILKKINPSNQDSLSNATLENTSVNSDIARDQTQDDKLTLSATDNNFANVKAGQPYTQKVNVKIETVQKKETVDVAKVSEQTFSNIIPFEAGKNTRNQAFASTTSTNENNSISDPGYRADLLYQEMRSYLRPSSWL